MARPERTDPRRFNLRSVTEAMPTPSSRISRENLILSLNLFFKKMVSNITVKGMMANFVIW
jgi:hypothetical protein